MKSWWRLAVLAILAGSLSILIGLRSNAQSVPSLLVQKAQQQYQAGNFVTAIELLETANQIYKSREEHLQQAQIFSLISLAQQQLGNWDAAEQNIDFSWKSFNRESETEQKTQVKAQIWNNQGHFELARGKEKKALEAWKNAEQLYRQIEDNLGTKGSLINQARAIENLGYYNRACDRILSAFNLENDCRNLETKGLTEIIRQTETQPSIWQIQALTSLGNTSILMGNLSQAEMFIKTSQILAKKLRQTSPIMRSQNILSLGNLHRAIALQEKEWGNSASFAYNTQAAIDYYQQLGNIKASSYIVQKYRLKGQLNHLSMSIATEQWALARSLVARINFDPSNSIPSRSTIIAAIDLADSLTKLKLKSPNISYSWQKVSELYEWATSTAHYLGDRRLESYAIGYLGQLQQEQNLSNKERSSELVEQALNLAQSISAPEIAYRWQWQLGRIYRQRGERVKAIAAYQAAVNTLGNLRSDLASLDKEVRFSFREQVEPVYREFADLLLVRVPSSGIEIVSEKSQNVDRTLISPAELEMSRNIIESLQLAELDNYFHDACVAFEPRNIEEIDTSAAVIYTIILPDRLEVILSLGDRTFYRHTQNIAQAELEKNVTQLRQYIVQPDRTNDVKQLSSQLYDWLIRPFEKDLAKNNTQTLVFVLDSALQTIPMSVLYDGQQYLIEQYAISLTPGLRLLNARKEKNEFPILAAGVSQSLQVENQKFAALDNVKIELNNIQGVLPSKILLDREFTKDKFVEQLQTDRISIVHLATHGRFSSNPNDTFLLLWQQLLSIKEFDFLLQTRKKAISEPLDLLVLSACETAAGDKRAALGLAGIAVRTKASSTLATLWQVGDRSTALLMNDFYAKLNTKKYTKAQALQKAQIDFIRDRELGWQAPASWAAYIMVGDWQ